MAYVVLRLQGQALLWAAAVWEGPETKALHTFSTHLMAKFGRPVRDPVIQANRLGLHQQVMEELCRSLATADPPPTVSAAPTPTSLRVTTPAPTHPSPRTHEVWIQPEIVGVGDNAIREAYRTGYPVYAHNYDSEEDEENVLDKAIREDLLYAYYDSEEEDISEWIDGDFITFTFTFSHLADAFVQSDVQ